MKRGNTVCIALAVSVAFICAACGSSGSPATSGAGNELGGRRRLALRTTCGMSLTWLMIPPLPALKPE